jgi:hypothetical protein
MNSESNSSDIKGLAEKINSQEKFLNLILKLSEKNANHLFEAKQDIREIKTKLEFMPSETKVIRLLERHSKNPMAHGRVQLTKKQMIILVSSLLTAIPAIVSFLVYFF